MGCTGSHPRVGTGRAGPVQMASGATVFDNEESSSSSISVYNSQRSFCSFGSLIEQGGVVQIFEWEFGELIGTGAKSRVYLVRNSHTDEEVAAKVYNKTMICKPSLGTKEIYFDKIKLEIQTMAEINSPYVLPIIEVIEDDYTESFIILFPYAQFGTLKKYAMEHKMEERDLQLCFLQIAKALSYIHSLDIVHRDIKPDNILVFAENCFKLADGCL